MPYAKLSVCTMILKIFMICEQCFCCYCPPPVDCGLEELAEAEIQLRQAMSGNNSFQTQMLNLSTIVNTQLNEFSGTNENPCENETYQLYSCLLYTSPSPRDKRQSRMPSSA